MNNLTWKKVGDAYYLASSSEEMVKLQYEIIGKSVFWMNNEVYQVKRSGFWNQRYSIYTNNREVVSVSHNFWGSKGKIQFSDGTQYTSDYNNSSKLTLRFLNAGEEIVSYCVGSDEGKQQITLNLGIALVDAEKLLILATLGMVMFLNIFNEFNSDDGDFLVLVAAS